MITDIIKKSIEEDLQEIKKCKLDILILQRKNEELCQENNKKIAELTEKITSLETELKENLEKSKEKKIDTPAGWCAFRKMPDKWEYDDDKIIDWCKKFDFPYYKTIEVVKRKELKKDAQSGILNIEGVPGVKVIPQEPKFHYKITEVI